MSSVARKPWWRRWFGTRSERAAGQYLRRQGFRILAWNHFTPHGEIDIIAAEAGCVVFVEVRSTGEKDSSRPAESVDQAKQARLTACALDYLRHKRLLEHPTRFDVLIIHWPADQREPRITHHRHAFEAAGRWQTYS